MQSEKQVTLSLTLEKRFSNKTQKQYLVVTTIVDSHELFITFDTKVMERLYNLPYHQLWNVALDNTKVK